MQKLVKISDPSIRDINDFNKEELIDGWNVKQMTAIGPNLIVLLEKETRKDKLEKLDEISSS